MVGSPTRMTLISRAMGSGFSSGPAPDPLCRAEVNGDGVVNMVDALYLNNYIFQNDLYKEDFDGSFDVYVGPMITVLGTSLQNRDMLERFRRERDLALDPGVELDILLELDAAGDGSRDPGRHSAVRVVAERRRDRQRGLLQGPVDQPRREEVGRLDQGGGRHADGHVDDAVLDHARDRDQNHQGPARPE